MTVTEENKAYSCADQDSNDNYYLRCLRQLSESDPIAFQKFISNASTSSNNDSVLLPDGKTELSHDGKIKLRDEDGILVTPNPEFVIKTFLVPKDQAFLPSSFSQKSIISSSYQSKKSMKSKNEVNDKSFQTSKSKNDPMNNTIKKDKKLFINVCSNEFVKEPKTIKKLNENNEEIEGYNIPISVGPIRTCYDKSNTLSNVIDCIVNTRVIELSTHDSSYRLFLIQVVLEYVNNKYFNDDKDKNNIITSNEVNDHNHGSSWCYIDTKNFKLPKLKYIGYVNDDLNDNRQDDSDTKHSIVPKQWIRDHRKMLKIEEVDLSQNSSTAQNNKVMKNDVDIDQNDRKSQSLPNDDHLCNINYDNRTEGSKKDDTASNTSPINASKEKVQVQKQKQDDRKIEKKESINYEFYIQGVINSAQTKSEEVMKEISLSEFIQCLNKCNDEKTTQKVEKDAINKTLSSFLHPLIYDVPEKGITLGNKKEKNEVTFHACKLCIQSMDVKQQVLQQLQIDASPYMVTFSLSASTVTELILPFSILTKSIECTYNPDSLTLTLLASLDKTVTSSMERYPDPGSKAWNLQNALSSDNTNANINFSTANASKRDATLDSNVRSDDFKRNVKPGEEDSSNKLLEENEYDTDYEDDDNFPNDSNMIDNLPEDKFHVLDPMSQYLLEQQKKQQQKCDDIDSIKSTDGDICSHNNDECNKNDCLQHEEIYGNGGIDAEEKNKSIDGYKLSKNSNCGIDNNAKIISCGIQSDENKNDNSCFLFQNKMFCTLQE